MANVGQFESLDGKLSAALTKIMTGELGRKVNQIKETGTKGGILGWCMTTTGSTMSFVSSVTSETSIA